MRRVLAVNNFGKKPPSYMFGRILNTPLGYAGAIVRRCSVKKDFLKILQYLRENKVQYSYKITKKILF